jgi:hypothetical protein
MLMYMIKTWLRFPNYCTMSWLLCSLTDIGTSKTHESRWYEPTWLLNLLRHSTIDRVVSVRRLWFTQMSQIHHRPLQWDTYQCADLSLVVVLSTLVYSTSLSTSETTFRLCWTLYVAWTPSGDFRWSPVRDHQLSPSISTIVRHHRGNTIKLLLLFRKLHRWESTTTTPSSPSQGVAIEPLPDNTSLNLNSLTTEIHKHHERPG